MHRIAISANNLSASLLDLAADRNVCILDSCGVTHQGSHLMIAGIEPIEIVELKGAADDILARFATLLRSNYALIFSISYDLAYSLNFGKRKFIESDEPGIFAAVYDSLAVHDYSTGETFITGNDNGSELIEKQLKLTGQVAPDRFEPSTYSSNFHRLEYMNAIETIKEHIRDGNKVQANLTQQLTAELEGGLTPEVIFARLRRDHPAPFAAFLKRSGSTVVSASPERFFKMSNGNIFVSPIKGTRPRGVSKREDDAFRAELLSSEKDRAENTMIVDLLRNDLGRVCEYGSVQVARLCELEEHPTLFHLVSTIRGKLKRDAIFIDALRSLFPCGSITGAPKIRTMEIIDELEPSQRGLSMGAIGYYIPESAFDGLEPGFDLSVAIRTMVIREGKAVFNVGGGITIDSDPEAEYQESMIKAKALLAALGNK